MVVRGPNESLLVERGLHASFDVARNPMNHGMYDVVVHDFDGDVDVNITDGIKTGELAGIIHVRDEIGYHNNDNNISIISSNSKTLKQ